MPNKTVQMGNAFKAPDLRALRLSANVHSYMMQICILELTFSHAKKLKLQKFQAQKSCFMKYLMTHRDQKKEMTELSFSANFQASFVIMAKNVSVAFRGHNFFTHPSDKTLK